MKLKHKAPFLDFDFRVFCEGFRQLKTVGIVTLIILCLAAVLLPTSLAISSYTFREYEQVGTSFVPVYTRELVPLASMHPLVFSPMYTIALLMPLILFSFLNKRQASDFYHALPTSRAGVFVSFFAAIMAWILLILLASTAVSVITLSCFPKLFKIVWSSILPTLCISLSGALMVAGCMIFAMCITGTLFTNLLVAALLFFGPRILMWYISTAVTNGVDILPDVEELPILSIAYNIPLGLLKGGISNFANWKGILYSATIGVLYFFAGLAVFRVRRSEAAEQPAATPLLQTVYRLSVTFVVTLLPMWILIEGLQGEKPTWRGELFTIFSLFVLAALVFCVYELITTKKPKQLLKAAPTFLLVLVADALLISSVLLGTNGILAFRPAPEQIQAVSFEATNSQGENARYFNAVTSGVKTDNKEVAALISKHLAASARLNSPHGGYDDTEWYDYTVTVYTGGTGKKRMLSLTSWENREIYEQLAENTACQHAYTLPALTGDAQVYFSHLKDEQAVTVYEIMREEVAQIPFKERRLLLTDMHDEKTGLGVTAVLQIALSGTKYTLSFPLTPEHYPKAYEAYLRFMFENETEEREKIYYWMDSIFDREMSFTMRLTNRETDYQRVVEADSRIMTAYAKGLLVDQLLPRISTAQYGKDDTLLHIYFQMPKINSDRTVKTESFQWDAYFTVSEDFLSCNAFLEFAAEADERKQNAFYN